MKLLEEIKKIKRQGYDQSNAEARLCQDIIIQAIASCPLNKNVTIKGGVVMRSMSQNVRRATRDLDIDFIRYSIENKSIEKFIDTIDCLEDIKIKRVGDIEELKQQDYHGKRVHIEISDEYGHSIISKLDLGVHNNLEIEQEEYCFDISFSEDGVNLLINSKEQMFTEKLCSLLKFGSYSTRHKDIFDMYYLSQYIDKDKLVFCFQRYIFNNEDMKENTISDVLGRIRRIFGNAVYTNKLVSTNTNWLDIEISVVLNTIEKFVEELMKDVA